jgi:AcrR family transcriptional regulator
MSPQQSNRGRLVEGAIACLERLPPERVTARAIAEESGANLASIGYHFGSKDALVSEAAVTGLDRWLEEIEEELGDLHGAFEAVERTRRRHAGLARHFVTALARAQHDARVRETLVDGFRRTRPKLASLLGLGDDEAGEDAAGLALSLFHGLLYQVLLDPGLAIEGRRMERAQARLSRALTPPDRDPSPPSGARRR